MKISATLHLPRHRDYATVQPGPEDPDIRREAVAQWAFTTQTKAQKAPASHLGFIPGHASSRCPHLREPHPDCRKLPAGRPRSPYLNATHCCHLVSICLFNGPALAIILAYQSPSQLPWASTLAFAAGVGNT